MMTGNEKDDARVNSSDFAKAPSHTRVITVADDKIDSRDLFVSGRQITITHGSETYSLRLTAQNKLILTK